MKLTDRSLRPSLRGAFSSCAKEPVTISLRFLSPYARGSLLRNAEVPCCGCALSEGMTECGQGREIFRPSRRCGDNAGAGPDHRPMLRQIITRTSVRTSGDHVRADRRSFLARVISEEIPPKVAAEKPRNPLRASPLHTIQAARDYPCSLCLPVLSAAENSIPALLRGQNQFLAGKDLMK